MEDQGSKSNASEGAPDKGSQSPEEVVKDDKTQSENCSCSERGQTNRRC